MAFHPILSGQVPAFANSRARKKRKGWTARVERRIDDRRPCLLSALLSPHELPHVSPRELPHASPCKIQRNKRESHGPGHRSRSVVSSLTRHPSRPVEAFLSRTSPVTRLSPTVTLRKAYTSNNSRYTKPDELPDGTSYGTCPMVATHGTIPQHTAQHSGWLINTRRWMAPIPFFAFQVPRGPLAGDCVIGV